MKNDMKPNDSQKNENPLSVILFATVSLTFVFLLLAGFTTNHHSAFAFFIISWMFLFFSLKLLSISKGIKKFSMIPVTSVVFWAASLMFLFSMIPFEEHTVPYSALEMGLIFGVCGCIALVVRLVATKNRNNIVFRINLIKMILIWLAPFRILLSSAWYIAMRPEVSPVVWVIHDSWFIIFSSLFLVLLMELHKYMSRVLDSVGDSGKILSITKFIPIGVIFLVFMYGSHETILEWETSPFEGQFMDVHAIATLINNVGSFLRETTILEIQGYLFVGYTIVVIIIGLTVANLSMVFMSLKRLLFNSGNRNSADKLHLVICTIILIVLCIWSLFAVVLFVFPESFGYENTDILRLLFDALYYACTSWMVGSWDIAPSTVMARTIVLVSVISNVFFFIVFITGIFSDATEKSSQIKNYENEQSTLPQANKKIDAVSSNEAITKKHIQKKQKRKR